MGSAQGPAITAQENIKKAELLGEAIAKSGCILVNGACPGLPDNAASGAKRVGGFVLGISPAFSLREHVERFSSPIENYDIILYTGMGLMERDIVNIRSSDAIITIGGGIGTLNEFTVAFDEGKYIGVLTGTNGISDHISHIVDLCHRELTEKVIFDDNPERLVKRLLKAMANGNHPIVEDQRIVNLDWDPFERDNDYV